MSQNINNGVCVKRVFTENCLGEKDKAFQISIFNLQSSIFNFQLSHSSVRKGKRGRPAPFLRLPIWKFLKQ